MPTNHSATIVAKSEETYTAILTVPSTPGVLYRTATAINEAAIAKGHYTVVFQDVAAGDYDLWLYYTSNGQLAAAGPRRFTGVANETAITTPQATVTLDPSTQDQLDRIETTMEDLIVRMQSTLGNVVVSIFNRMVDGFPLYLRKGDARTVANGGAIFVRIYATDDEEYTTPLRGCGDLLFEDAEDIQFALMLVTNTLTLEDTPEVQFAITWEQPGDDGYFVIAYDADALDPATTYVPGVNKFHEWGIKVRWPTDAQPITVAEGMTKVYNKIVANPTP